MPDDELDDLFAGVDKPRPLPTDLRDRLHATLAPGAMPHLLRRRLERVLIRRSAQRWLPVGAAAAAVLAFLIGAVAFRGDDPAERLQEVVIATTTSTSTTMPVPVAALPSERPPAATAGGGSAGTAADRNAEASGSTPAGAAARPSGPRLPPFAESSDDQAPPKRDASSAAPASDGGGAASSTSTSAERTSADAVKIGLIGGDAAQERGFRAYVGLVNDAGGLDARRTIELVSATPTAPAVGTVVSVNLSGQAVTAWKGGPIVETMNAAETSLKGEVFGLAGPAERQARIVADLMIPDTAPGLTAAIYVGGAGAWSDAVPAAYEEVLRARGVATFRVPVEPERPTTLQLADAAFLSLDPARLSAFADEVKAAAYKPRLGIASVWSAFDPTLAGRLPDGTKVLSPWQPARGNEANAMLQRAGAPINASVLHGWAVAKSVAVSLAKHPDADTAAEVTDALAGLAGYSPLLAPSFEFRKGTRSRTPEGRLFELTAAGFTAKGDWRRDTTP